MSKFKFIDRGKKETFLLIPGWATDYRVFDGVDMPANYLLPVEYSPYGFTDDLATAREIHGIKDFSILGWSMGCFVACDVIEQFRGSVDKVILISARKEYGRENNENIKTILGKNRKGFLRKFYNDCFTLDEKDRYARMKELFTKEYIEDMVLSHLADGLDYLSERCIDPRSLEGMDVTFIHGREDKIAPLGEAAELAGRIPRARMMVMERTGHMPFLASECGTILDGDHASV